MPGRIGWCSSATSAVRLRRGSTTTSFPPRARSAFNRPRMSGAVISEPFEASGFAPSISRCIVRSTSGIGTDSGVAEHQRAGDLLRPLVDRAGREHAVGAERLDHDAAVEQRGEPVGGGVADVDADGVAAVLGGDPGQAVADQRPRLLPARGRELAVRAADQRGAEPVGVLVQVLQRHALRAEEAAREHVVAVAADLDDLIAAQGDLQAAGRLAERTRPERGALHQRQPTRQARMTGATRPVRAAS